MNTNAYIYTPTYSGSYIPNSIRIEGANLERRIDNLRTKLSIKKPDVFVSHKSEDKNAAEDVAKTIAKCGLTAYLDIWDPNVDGDGPELVNYIQSVIGCCNSLIAVVSHNTVRSWWVPLEIGIAITKDLYLGTFLTSTYITSNFPSYLWEWPVLRNTRDLENWCRKRRSAYSTQQFYASLEQNYPRMFRQ